MEVIRDYLLEPGYAKLQNAMLNLGGLQSGTIPVDAACWPVTKNRRIQHRMFHVINTVSVPCMADLRRQIQWGTVPVPGGIDL